MHELGHTLGLDDLVPSQDATDLMTETLPTGVRRLPSAQDLAALTPAVGTSEAALVNASTSVNPSLPAAGQESPVPVLHVFLAPPSMSMSPVTALISRPVVVASVSGGGGSPLPGIMLGVGPVAPAAVLALGTGPGWVIEPTPWTDTTSPVSVETELATNLARTLPVAGGTNDPLLDVGLGETRDERDPWSGIWGNGQV
jgi:hypothetical protein